MSLWKRLANANGSENIREAAEQCMERFLVVTSTDPKSLSDSMLHAHARECVTFNKKLFKIALHYQDQIIIHAENAAQETLKLANAELVLRGEPEDGDEGLTQGEWTQVAFGIITGALLVAGTVYVVVWGTREDSGDDQ
jgi:hypothetical protein